MDRLRHQTGMPNGFKFKLTLRITHPAVDPSEISETLGLQPEFSHRVGMPRATPKGEPMPGLHTESLWGHTFDHDDEETLVDVLHRVNERLSKHVSFFQRLRDTGGGLEYFVGWFADFNSGEVLDWKVMGDCAAMRIDLALDVYGAESRRELKK